MQQEAGLLLAALCRAVGRSNGLCLADGPISPRSSLGRQEGSSVEDEGLVEQCQTRPLEVEPAWPHRQAQSIPFTAGGWLSSMCCTRLHPVLWFNYRRSPLLRCIMHAS